MATRLYRNDGKQNVESNTIKLKIDCKNRIDSDTKDWLELVSLFNQSDGVVYKALLEKHKYIVAYTGKFDLTKEYETAKKLEALKLPTIIRLNCIFNCLDDFSKLEKSPDSPTKPVSVILMPFLEEGRIDEWTWKRANFDLMKNIIKHVFLSAFYAKSALGFVHRDLHLGNILLKKTQCKEISYGEYGTLDVHGIIPVIMDFDKSAFVENYDALLYKDLSHFIGLMGNYCNVKFNANIIQDYLDKTLTAAPITPVIYSNLSKHIDNLEIRKVDSEMPPLPNFLLQRN
jgi:hypothetical protein